MSNSLAIAAVTSTLRHMMDGELGGGINVTTLPPDRARNGQNGNQINLFLYHVEVSGAWRNGRMPLQTRPSEPAEPPLGLNLRYLLTAYGQADDDVSAHEILGRAMLCLHDRPVLNREEIRGALNGNDLGDQVERVRLTPQALSLEETSKMWTAFQVNYRISAAYEAAVVLIESARTTPRPLPVLTRGKADHGVYVYASMLPPYPTLFEVEIPRKQPSVRPGDIITLRGHELGGDDLEVFLQHRRWEEAKKADGVMGGTDDAIRLLIPAGALPAGIYSVHSKVKPRDQEFPRESNDVTFALAPEIMSKTVNRVGDVATLEIEVSPPVLKAQKVELLLGSRPLPPTDRDDPRKLKFRITGAKAGDKHWIRVRVDGVDSHLVTDYDQPVPSFDSKYEVKIP
ncbi:MAG TPA: DUF4255 domain-containing protein [Candidatus Eisenbacteria bacterium]|nr:DUF4255 domain-containing protein [Candidatus Eisenbacteria bacterium]